MQQITFFEYQNMVDNGAITNTLITQMKTECFCWIDETKQVAVRIFHIFSTVPTNCATGFPEMNRHLGSNSITSLIQTRRVSNSICG